MSISMTPGGVAGRIRHLEETEGNASDVNISQGERIAVRAYQHREAGLGPRPLRLRRA